MRCAGGAARESRSGAAEAAKPLFTDFVRDVHHEPNVDYIARYIASVCTIAVFGEDRGLVEHLQEYLDDHADDADAQAAIPPAIEQ